MFDHTDSVIGLSPGEGTEFEALLEAEDQLAFEVACGEMADGLTTPDRHVLPSDLESIPPGPYLAAILSSVDVEKLNGHDAVRMMQSRARLASHNEAGKYEAMAEVAFSPPGNADSPVEREPNLDIDVVSAEVAAALTLTRQSSKAEVGRAVSLKDRLARVLEAFSQGRVDSRKVRVFESQLSHLPEETVDTVLDETLDDASEVTTGQLRDRVQKRVMAADPDGASSSFREGLANRKVTTNPNPDFTGSLHVLNGHPEVVAAARSHVEKLARELKTEDETRTLDQLRHDVALDLLSGRCMCGRGGSAGGKTNITIPGETLIGLADEPGELGGYGPVIAEIARKTVYENIDGEWRFTVTDNGKPVSTGTLARRPTPAQQRQVEAWYPKCTAPGCRLDAWDCDLDHRQPWQHGGETCIHNLAPLCRYHHQLKTDGGWELQRLENGDHQWTSPLGHTYIRERDPPG